MTVKTECVRVCVSVIRVIYRFTVDDSEAALVSTLLSITVDPLQQGTATTEHHVLRAPARLADAIQHRL